MTRIVPLIVLSAVLTACGQQNVNPPTEPAEPVTGPEAEPPKSDEAGTRPGMGAASFVGVWTADPAWCANTSGAERPIRITPTRFEGYENSCLIESVDEGAGGWTVHLRCEAEGQVVRERVNASVADDVLTLDYPDRGGDAVKLTRCPTPTD